MLAQQSAPNIQKEAILRAVWPLAAHYRSKVSTVHSKIPISLRVGLKQRNSVLDALILGLVWKSSSSLAEEVDPSAQVWPSTFGCCRSAGKPFMGRDGSASVNNWLSLESLCLARLPLIHFVSGSPQAVDLQPSSIWTDSRPDGPRPMQCGRHLIQRPGVA